MKAELLTDATYKITLDKHEAKAVPCSGKPCEMRQYICALIDKLRTEQGISLPCGRLLVEAFARSDGSCVLFLSSLESEKRTQQPRYYACEIEGIGSLRPICAALSRIGEKCSVFCGSRPDRYRIIFTNPSRETEHICTEFGDYCEISALFEAQTREYLTEISSGSASALAEILG